MADIGAEFSKFLIANHMDAYNKIASDTVKDSVVNSIISQYKSDFDAWLKIPAWIRDKYRGRVPREIIEKAKNDPNFTESDAVKADKEYRERGNSEINAVREHDYTAEVATIGIALTVADIAQIKLNADEISKKGYGYQASQDIAIDQNYMQKVYETQGLSDLYFEIGEHMLNTAKDDLAVSQPERALVRLLRDINCGKKDQAQSEGFILEYLDLICKNGRMEQFEEQIDSPMFKRLSDDTKEYLYGIVENIPSLKDFERVRAQINLKIGTPEEIKMAEQYFFAAAAKGRGGY